MPFRLRGPYLACMLIAWIPILVAIVGLLIYALSTNPKASEAGRLLLFFCGTFVTVWTLSRGTVKLL